MTNLGDVTDNQFKDDVLDSIAPVLVDFWAEWCEPCKTLSPVLDEIGNEAGKALKVARLNVDKNPETTRKYGAMSIPTLILFKDGQEVARMVGAKPKTAILEALGPFLTLWPTLTSK